MVLSIADCKYFANRVNDFLTFPELEQLNSEQLWRLKNLVRNIKNISYDCFSTSVKAYALTGDAIYFEAFDKLLRKDQLLSPILNWSITNQTMPSFLLDRDGQIIINEGIKHDSWYVYDFKYDYHLKIPELKSVCNKLCLTSAELLSLVQKCSWQIVVKLLFLIQRLIVSKHYYMNYLNMASIIKKAIVDDKIAWLVNILEFVYQRKLTLTCKFDEQWYIDNSVYPLEFCKENMLSGDLLTEDDYNMLVQEKIAIIFRNYEHMEVLSAFIHDYLEKYLTSQLTYEDARLDVNKVINGVNLKKNITALSKIVVKSIPLSLKKILEDVMNDAESCDQDLLGFNIFADSDANPYYCNYTNGLRYFKLATKYQLVLKYMQKVFSDDNTIYRWLLWWRLQQWLRQNKVVAKGYITTFSYISKLPVELTEWLEQGVVPQKITLTDNVYVIIPKRIQKRLQKYPLNLQDYE